MPFNLPPSTARPWWVLLLLTTSLTIQAAGTDGRDGAVQKLLERAAGFIGAQQPQRAVAVLERAQRIAPRHAQVWHYLGQAYLHLGKYEQAEAMALKSKALATKDPLLRGANTWLAAAARLAAKRFTANGKAQRPIIADRTDPQTAVLEERLAQEIERRQAAEQRADNLAQLLQDQREQQRHTTAQRQRFYDDPDPHEGYDDPYAPMPETGYRDRRHAGHVPRGYLPPPGQCRIWYDNRPPARQPPPGDCSELSGRLPEGARLIRRL